MATEVPGWQRVVVSVGFVVWLLFVPGAWLLYVFTGSEGDLYGAGFAFVVFFTGGVCLCVGGPLAILSIINRRRWGVGLHALALAPFLALFCFFAYYLLLVLRALWPS